MYVYYYVESEPILTNTLFNICTVVRFEVSTAVTMMIIIFWEMPPCGFYSSSRRLYKSLLFRSVPARTRSP
jgi:hypothetical protein